MSPETSLLWSVIWITCGVVCITNKTDEPLWLAGLGTLIWFLVRR